MNFLNSLQVTENVNFLNYLLPSNNSFNTENVIATSFVFTTIIVSVKQLTVSSILICLLATWPYIVNTNPGTEITSIGLCTIIAAKSFESSNISDLLNTFNNSFLSLSE